MIQALQNGTTEICNTGWSPALSFRSDGGSVMSKAKGLKAGDKVAWDTPQGETHGTVVKAETGNAKAGGHTAKASRADPQYRVKSDKTGKEAIHKPEALRKT